MKKISSVRRCRICAREEHYNDFSNIFDDDQESELEKKIMKLLPIVVMPWDPMPHIICSDCINKLNCFNDFYEASIKAERFLRTLYPSAPETKLENLDPVVQIIDGPALGKRPLKLSPKKYQEIPERVHTSTDVALPSEFIEIIGTPNRGTEDVTFAKRTLNCFIINHITSHDVVFTCRKCFRTFTKQSSALNHSCVTIEDCRELGTLDEVGEKSLPPLKIRLFSFKSGLYVCYLCQSPFENKTELVEHIKRHFLDGKWENEVRSKYGRRAGRGKRKSLLQNGKKKREDDDKDEDWEKAYKKTVTRKKGKKSSEPPKKRRRAKSAEAAEQSSSGMCLKCINSSPVKETMEQTTQCFNISADSEADIKIKDKDSQVEAENLREEDLQKQLVISSINKTILNESELDNGNDPIEISTTDRKSDEITILEVINNKTQMSYSCCVFCDKVFATKDALIAHQNKHLLGYASIKSERPDMTRPTDTETYTCSICGMAFTNRKTLLEHEQFHLVDSDAVGNQRKIRISLEHDCTERDDEQEYQPSKGRDIITITVTSTEKKIPQIEFI